MQEQQSERHYLEQSKKLSSDTITIKDAFVLQYSCPSQVYQDTNIFNINVTITPLCSMPNLPLQVQIKGYSHILNIQIPSSLQDIYITQSLLIQQDENRQNRQGMNPSFCMKKGERADVEADIGGQYFLQGCQVLYQLEEQKQQRLSQLRQGKKYTYPVEFMLPPNLPVSLQHRLLKSVHMTIRYSIQLKWNYQRQGHIHQFKQTLPFKLIQPPKIYPYEELAVTQKIRCYHSKGKKQEEHSKSSCYQISKTICPLSLFTKMYPRQYSQHFQTFDVFFVELLAIVNKDHHLFITLRCYKQPQTQQLSVFREKKKPMAQHVVLNQDKTISEMPPEVSLTSIKYTQRKSAPIMLQKIEVEMWSEIKGIKKELVFSKDIYLTRQTYDMVEGEAVVPLKDYLDYPRSCINQLFQLNFWLKVKAIFQSQEGTKEAVEQFVVQQTIKQLQL